MTLRQLACALLAAVISNQYDTARVLLGRIDEALAAAKRSEMDGNGIR
jgi:hypothetical protein